MSILNDPKLEALLAVSHAESEGQSDAMANYFAGVDKGTCAASERSMFRRGSDSIRSTPLESRLAALHPSIGRFDHCKHNVYDPIVIRSFSDKETERFYTTGKSRRMPPEIRKRAAMRLVQLNAAVRVEDLRVPPSNRLERLRGDRAAQWSMRINDQWRVCFRFRDGDAFDVEIVDYH